MPDVLVRAAAGGEQRLSGGPGETVMRVIQRSGRTGFGECQGALACATCHVVVDPFWADRLPAPSEDEESMLDTVFDLKPGSRLSCQIRLDAALDGITVSLP